MMVDVIFELCLSLVEFVGVCVNFFFDDCGVMYGVVDVGDV